jgi:hypothetical protein
MSVEWRLRDGLEALLLVDDSQGGVMAQARPDEEALQSFLAVTGTGDVWKTWAAWNAVDNERRDPEAWGELILSRADTGEVLTIAPELFWESVHRWFRSRGVDFGPH